MNCLYVVGGRQKPGATGRTPEWHLWGGGLIVEVDLARGEVRPCAEYVSPPEACAAEDDPSIVFKAGTLDGDRFYACTQTELLVYSVPDFRRVGYVSLPRFNDLHHVRPGRDGTLLVANTGLDTVVEVTPEGAVRREWSVLGEDVWQRFSVEVDYRRVATTKPHHAHPNFVFEVRGEIWTTRFLQRDAICLTRPGWRIPLEGAPNHDGEVLGDRVYFTSVDAHVVIADAVTLRKERDVDLNAIAGDDAPLGWCRGLAVLDEDHVAVGFSRLRPTRFRENLRWLKHKLGGSGLGLAPTRIVVFDLTRGKRCWEQDLEGAGMNIVFSVHSSAPAAPPPPGGQRGQVGQKGQWNIAPHQVA
jgi:hypothetical protein